MTEAVQLKNIKIGEGMPKICVPMVGKTKEELCKEAAALLEAGADMAEWRADFFADIYDMEKVRETWTAITDIFGQLPLIFTIRTKAEGGNLQISTGDYVNIIQKVSQFARETLLDVEYFREEGQMKKLIAAIHADGGKVIASSHNFSETPPREALLQMLLRLEASGGDILKLAVMPRTFLDVCSLLKVTKEMTERHTNKPVVTMAMGELGAASRILGEPLGSAITFGVVGKASAPGQLAIRQLKDMLRLFHQKS